MKFLHVVINIQYSSIFCVINVWFALCTCRWRHYKELRRPSLTRDQPVSRTAWLLPGICSRRTIITTFVSFCSTSLLIRSVLLIVIYTQLFLFIELSLCMYMYTYENPLSAYNLMETKLHNNPS